jgi:Family of unknown function (DUF5719)
MSEMAEPTRTRAFASMGDGARRLVICAVIVAALAGGTVASHLSYSSGLAPAGFAVPAAAETSAVAPQGVSSTAWYCASAQPATLILSSRSPTVVTASVTRTAGGAGQSITVPAGGQVDVPPPARATGPVGETVTLDGGGVAVSESVKATQGWGVAQCASSTSPTWYFPQGSTVSGDTVTLDLYDPSVTQAVVDVDLVTASGEVEPTDYQGIAVPAGGLVTEQLDAHATNDGQVATVVEAASGSLVAEELQLTNSGKTVGVAEQLGAPRPQRVWGFPYCVQPSHGSLTFNVLNPGSQSTQVVLDATYGVSSRVHPVTVSVNANSTASIVLGAEPGFAASTPYAVVIESASGIVVGRSIIGHGKASLPNTSATIGVPVGAERWLLPAEPSIGHASSLAFEDLGSRPVEVTVTRALGGGAPVAGLGNVILVQPGEQVDVTQSVLGALTEPIDVDANGPMTLELDATPAASPGVVVIPAFVVP